jgi:hypothetical protein
MYTAVVELGGIVGIVFREYSHYGIQEVQSGCDLEGDLGIAVKLALKACSWMLS